MPRRLRIGLRWPWRPKAVAAAVWPLLLLRSLAATRSARLAPDAAALAAFGRRLGLRALVRGELSGIALLVTPVHSIRYWELPFTLRSLPARPMRCLDVSSPRLLSMFVAARRLAAEVTVINPDTRDAARTARLASLAGLQSLTVRPGRLEDLAPEPATYQAIWSISVVEHIPGDGDSRSVRQMFEALALGGRLILTVPVDRQPWDEFRGTDEYESGATRSPNGYFFQRWYDEESILRRLIQPAKPANYTLEWFGERTPGRFAAYEQRWQELGLWVTANDPLEISREYASFARWTDMPGRGVCGIVMEKTA